MRVVALLVVVCGCLAGPRSKIDAGAVDVPDLGGVDAPAENPGDSGSCQLLAMTCPNKEGCYPFPFEGNPSGATRCAFQGVGGPSVPCQSQLECDAMTICLAPGQPDSVCLQRCSLSDPSCPIGSGCAALAAYPGVGVCL